MNKKWFAFVAALMIGSLVLSACGTPEPEGPEDAAPTMLRVNMGQGDVPTLDPSLGSDTSSIQIVAELYVGLTWLDEVTLELKPGFAESWTASADGLTYTFNLMKNIPWVRFNGEEVEEVLDCDGNVRYVTAHDFEYGIKRTLIPDTASDYAYVSAFAFAGGDELLYAEDWADLDEEGQQALIDGVQAKAIDDNTLEVTFTSPAVYNLNIIGMWVAYAMPQWIIEEKGDRWTEPGFNQSYGPYALEEWVHDSYILLTVNPFCPGTDAVPVPTGTTLISIIAISPDPHIY